MIITLLILASTSFLLASKVDMMLVFSKTVSNETCLSACTFSQRLCKFPSVTNMYEIILKKFFVIPRQLI